ncbi:hypothetical protein CF15_05470 [Pyrodictium occultum]|uniref:Uncharacterized protein n=1 Tax=Pyrodictium occultum TaxID=2309 RepID=A0A0V8RVZ6_PYROC|nr:hypothetical protein [Pyrodictium occultum]KSW12209.1 hypothetical protein CF15_05470 [Pyrodictium occultum]
MGLEWLLPILFLAYTRQGLDRRTLAGLLGVPGSTVRRLLWAAARRGLVTVNGSSIEVTERGAGLVGRVYYAARAPNKFVLLTPGRLVLVAVRPRRGLRGYTVPLSLACWVYRAVLEGAAAPREAAARLGIHPKTASLAMRALRVLGCPGAGCVLAEACRDGKE